MSTTVNAEYLKLRASLNPYIKGSTVTSLLTAVATGGTTYMVDTIEEIHDNLYIATATDRYLDALLAAFGITRPANIGISNDLFSQVGIEVKNRKQVRDLINQLLRIIFGDESTKASHSASEVEPYALQDGDTLIVEYDGASPVTINFKTSEFTSIGAATAREIADIITKSTRNLGLTGSAIVKNDGLGNYVALLSDTIGPSSSLSVVGGRAQNVLKFATQINTTAAADTEWVVTTQAGGFLRFTWNGSGTDPQIGRASVGDYVNIFGGGFSDTENTGSYTITALDSASFYFEVYNPSGVNSSGAYTQGTVSAMLFYSVVKNVVATNLSYAALYQTAPNLLQIFLPPVTNLSQRLRLGASFAYDPDDSTSVAAGVDTGPFVYDSGQSFTVGGAQTTLSRSLDATLSRVISVADSSLFPDSSGYFVLGYGFDSQEGPIPYIARPTNTTLLISPIYTIQNFHPQYSTFTFLTQPTAAGTVTIGATVLTAVAGAPGALEFQIGADMAETAVNLANAVSISGLTAQASTDPDTDVSTVLITSTSVSTSTENMTLASSDPLQITAGSVTGTEVALASSLAPAVLSPLGLSYPMIASDTSGGRLYAQELIESIVAAGVTIVFVVLYPSQNGLGRNEISEIYGA